MATQPTPFPMNVYLKDEDEFRKFVLEQALKLLPERLRGTAGLRSLLTECRASLDPTQNISLLADIDAVLGDSFVPKPPES